NQMWEDGATWAVRRMRKHFPDLDRSVLKTEMAAMIADPDSYPASESSSSGREDMTSLGMTTARQFKRYSCLLHTLSLASSNSASLIPASTVLL
ncbi:MAG: hypothetical protein Q8835_03290, partial [Sweet potato little leaf phytoplasma]|nr:hypothetical protein [Sweet potato little leaf phytoplasma]